jgi:hypothetical protein
MQPAHLLFAAFAGLCATLSAAPLTPETSTYPDIFQNPAMIQTDLRLPSTGLNTTEAEDRSQFFDVATTFDASLDAEITTDDRSLGASGSIPVPEPSPVIGIGLGSALIAIYGIYRLNFKEKRRGRRRKVPLRPLTVLR